MFFLPMSGCRNLHVDLGNILIIIFYHDFLRNGFGVLHFENLGILFFRSENRVP